MVTTLHIALLMQIVLATMSSSHGPEEYVRIERLSDRVLLAYWLGTGRCNLTAIKSEKGLVIVDTEMSPRIMAPIKERIEKEFGRKDWAYVINTHAHMHHTGGNCLFKNAVVVGHDNLPTDMEWLVDKQTDPARKREEIERVGYTLQNLWTVLPKIPQNRRQAMLIRSDIEFWERYMKDMREGYDVVKPSLTFADRHTLDLGDLQLKLVFFGRGHSQSDILIFVPQEKLLVTGAIVYQRRHLPEIGEQSQLQDVHRFMAVLDELLDETVKIDYLVPSHSPPLRKSDLKPVRDYYEKMLTEVKAAQRQGLTLEQATQQLSVRRKFPNFRDPQPGEWSHRIQQRNIRNLWQILQQEQNQND